MSTELIYWDSDCFLGWFKEEPGKVELCEGTIERADQGEALIFTSALTIAEVLWLRSAPPIGADKAALVRKFFRRSYIRIRNVTRLVSESAQDLVWSHGIRPKDAIHVATAIDAKAVALETFDCGLLKKSGTVGNPGLIIRQPIATKTDEVAAMNKDKPPAKADNKNQSKAFIEKAHELGCDKNSAAADELLGRLAKMPPNPRKLKIRKPGQ